MQINHLTVRFKPPRSTWSRIEMLNFRRCMRRSRMMGRYCPDHDPPPAAVTGFSLDRRSPLTIIIIVKRMIKDLPFNNFFFACPFF